MAHHYGEYVKTIITSTLTSSYSEKDTYRQTPIEEHPDVSEEVEKENAKKPIEVPRLLKYDKIAIGATHSSVLYSLLTNTPLIFAKGVETHPFDFHEAGTDLGAFGIESHDYELRTIDGKPKTIGAPKHYLTDRILPAFIAIWTDSILQHMQGNTHRGRCVENNNYRKQGI